MRLHAHVHRVGRGFHRAAPLHVDQAFTVFGHHLAQVGATHAVHADALATGDKAANGVGRCRFAAFGQLRHERANAHHQQAAFSGCRVAGFFKDRFVGGVGRGFGRAQHLFDAAQRELVLAHHLKQFVGFAKTQLRRQVVQLERRFAFALQKLLDCFAAFGDGFIHL